MKINTVVASSDRESNVPHTNMYQALLFDINVLEDKFANTLGSKQLSSHAREHASLTCDNFKQWKCQSRFDFGFVPLRDFVAPTTKTCSDLDIQCPVLLHFRSRHGTQIFQRLSDAVRLMMRKHG